MNNPLVPTAILDLDKPRKMRMDLNALADFESVSGKSIMQGFSIADLTVADLRALLWACLVQEDESVTERQVGALLHVGNLEGVTGQLASLFSGAMPEPEAGETADPLPETASPSPSKTSGPSPSTTSI